ncbi:MAG: putative glycosyltransferase, exosortase G system-associated [Anaerolineae bacterium CG_4_9_14_3_um_filter_57_17]|nr:putative glycosyltransferase, exosortase G system-associated [bacterium]NCT21571.1 putative glycosyltransferase, exosortase G system-associated [bacterium]OIO87270.1 MAG: putative glycosyltransferase, exosortase G system-associated [Anaerolineae bacterium CG2_30_57_67]PJB67752.1 MAG: putative glycosyltransferase, exosortase G system-associated [Anaerolineae bacterium CG_4_9_14_3_um_filter_57_17]
MSAFWAFVVFWGVWLLIPLAVDGTDTLVSLVTVFWLRLRARKPASLVYFPIISIIIPVYNSQETLRACLESIARQEYPLEKMEVFVVNNGSTDHSFGVFNEIQGKYGLNVRWMSVVNQGKAWALNAGIHMVRGNYVFNIDSDVVVSPEAIRRVVEAFESHPDVAAATGAIHVLPVAADAPWLNQVLTRCEYFEYLTAYHIGRAHQSILKNLYTLSGAFSVFRRDILVQTNLYGQETVTEDTDMTFHLYEKFSKYRIICVTEAIAYVHPIESLAALYAQRVRWQRGQVEVSARHVGLMQASVWKPYGFTPSRVLLIDHTLAFTRLVWTFFMPILILFGYPVAFIFTALFIIYIFYLLVDALWFFVSWNGVDASARVRLRADFWILPFMPAYRMIVFWFRVSGFLYAVAEPGQWRVQDPLTQSRLGFADMVSRTATFLRAKFSHKK